MRTHNRRDFLKALGLGAAAIATPGRLFAEQKQDRRPNILWILSEDISPDLSCYGTPAVQTPNLDELAHQGIRFNNAYTTGPVCSASRSAMITGMYQTSIGAHNHRSHRDDGYTLPEPVRLITEYFRQAGYFTANVKTAAPGVRGSGKTDFKPPAKRGAVIACPCFYPHLHWRSDDPTPACSGGFTPCRTRDENPFTDCQQPPRLHKTKKDCRQLHPAILQAWLRYIDAPYCQN